MGGDLGRKEGLEEGLKKMKELRKVFNEHVRIPGAKEGLNVELDKAIRLRDFLIMGELVAYDALNRNESCGGHFREESQTEEGEALRHDDEFLYVAAWEFAPGDADPNQPDVAMGAPILHKEDLVYEAIELKQRSYK